MVLELTDGGWATCAAIFGADVPERPSGQGRALYTCCARCAATSTATIWPLADVFFPLDDTRWPASPTSWRRDRGEVRAAYVRLAARPGGWVGLVRLRDELSGRAERRARRRADPAVPQPGVSLIPEENQKALTADDRAAAVAIGDQAQAPDRDRVLMEPQHREALGALRLTRGRRPPTICGIRRVHCTSAGSTRTRSADVMAAFGDASATSRRPARWVSSSAGPAGSGKTHLLGQVRERVQAAGGFFFIVELLDAASFWQSARGGILESLGRPGAERETQLKDLLWQLSSVAHDLVAPTAGPSSATRI